ncbi:MAG: hypothetical protein ABL929_00870 [Ferruginibacter sp.]|nr:hypothetical protein [Ferruginibacter sp.]
MGEYDEKLNSFKNRVNAAPAKTPIQEVRQVEIKIKTEVQLNVWIPKDLLQAVKLKAVNENKSIKQIVQQAVENYLALVP